MRRMALVVAAVGLSLGLVGSAAGGPVIRNGATADLDTDVTITFSDGLVLTFVPGHGMNGAYAYVYTDAGGTVEEDEQELGTWPDDTSSWSASATTSNGEANGSVTTNTAGFDYSIDADAMVEALDVGDYGFALGYAYAWPDWLRCDHSGTATVTIDYTCTVDARDTRAYGKAWVYMNAFFADHPGDNHLTAQGDWSVGYGSNPNTTIVEYKLEVEAGDYATVTDSVSWDIDIPNCSEPNNWWSLWAYGEAGVDVAPIPEPGALGLLGLGLVGLVRRKKRT